MPAAISQYFNSDCQYPSNLPHATFARSKAALPNFLIGASTKFETRSTWGKENDVLKLDIDPKSHSAWTGGTQKLLDKGRVSKYNKKFSNLRSKSK